MTKTTISRKTKYPGIYVYDPSAKKKRYYIFTRYGKNPITNKPENISRKVDRDKKPIYSIKRAKDYLQELKDEIDKSRKLNYKDEILYQDYAENIDMPQHKMEVRESTYRQNLTIYKLLIDWFGEYKLKDISVNVVDDFKLYLSKQGNISKIYGNLILAVLKKSLGRGVAKGYLEFNVMDKVKRFKVETKEMEIWTIEQFKEVLNQIDIQEYKENMYHCLFLTLFMSSARVGELQALYWENIDFSKRTIEIAYTLDYKNRQDWTRVYKTKTKSGKRRITLDKQTISVLKKWKKRQAKCCKSNFVFSLEGYPITISSANNQLKKYARMADVPTLKVHGLRHSSASYLLESGVNIVNVSKRLGHANISITMDVYAHSMPNSDEMIAEKLTNVINTQ